MIVSGIEMITLYDSDYGIPPSESYLVQTVPYRCLILDYFHKDPILII